MTDVRPGRIDDLPALTDIYNHYVTDSAATFDLEPFTAEGRRDWFDHYAETGPHRLYVATDADDVIGYATSGPLRPKPAYRSSVEVTVYLHPEATGRGAGAALYTQLFADLAAEGLHRAYAVIALPNPASIALHRRFGFRDIGVMHEVGHKHGRWWDVQWMERSLP